MRSDDFVAVHLRFVHGITQAIRLWNTRIMILFYLLGRSITQSLTFDRDLILIPIMLILSYAGVSVMNYYYDQDIDKLNKRSNPFIAYSFGSLQILTIVAIVQLSSLLIAIQTSHPIISVSGSLAILISGLMYKSKWFSVSHHPLGKITLMMIGYLVIPGILGIALHFSFYAVTTISLFALLYVSWMVFSDIKDIKGDKLFGKKTLAVLLGAETLSVISFAVAGGAASILLYIFSTYFFLKIGLLSMILMHGLLVLFPRLLQYSQVRRIGGYTGLLFLLFAIIQFQIV